MLAALARADARMGLRGAIDASSFKALDLDTVERLEAELQTTRLLYETKLLLSGITYFKDELYAPSADATERRAHVVGSRKRKRAARR
jgi:hypothetical protein